MSPLDLHVLSTPPAFVLSQDQTLSFNPVISLPVSQPARLNSFGITVSYFCVSINLYRFQGSVPIQRRSARVSLHILSNILKKVNTFFEVFSAFLRVFAFYERHSCIIHFIVRPITRTLFCFCAVFIRLTQMSFMVNYQPRIRF